jgi:membrane protease YdiL (CAAX protease family)
VLLGLFLRVRGWTLARLTLKPAWRDPAIALALGLACYAGYLLLFAGSVALWPGIGQTAATIATHLVGADLHWPAVLLASTVNPVFEELLLCAYPIVALRDRIGVTSAINVSAALRVFGHFYQGALGVLSIVPMALVFAYWYARTGRLWPIIIAHAMLDLAALAAHIN